MTIDTHFHYPSMLRRDNTLSLPESIIGLEIGLDGGDLESRIKLIGNNKNIYLSVGAGPWVLDREDFVSIDDEVEKLENDIIQYGADAIGEIGFDNHWAYGTKEMQLELFSKQIELARKYNLPVSIHSRDADVELENAIKERAIDDKTILHCFSSGPEMCSKLLESDAYISFAGNVTYKGNKLIQEAVRIVPSDRILVETDSPYLAPGKMRGKLNNPENTEITLDYLASLRCEDKEALKETIINNFLRLMGSSESKVKRDIATI